MCVFDNLGLFIYIYIFIYTFVLDYRYLDMFSHLVFKGFTVLKGSHLEKIKITYLLILTTFSVDRFQSKLLSIQKT